jgi:hypothetical protein
VVSWLGHEMGDRMPNDKDSSTAASSRGTRSRSARLVAALGVGLLLVLGAGRLGDLLPSLPNPFGTESVDRSQPPLLESLVDLSEYRAASANFQVIVDQEKDAKWLPAAIRGERAVFLAVGEVDAQIDFSHLDERSLTVSEDRRSARIVLPAPTLSKPRIHPEESRVVARQRGLLDRVGSMFSDSPTSERPLVLAAEGKMRTAGAESDLRARAEENTRRMLERMLHSLGYTSVSVTFAPSPA